jgi:hypothetical protein
VEFVALLAKADLRAVRQRDHVGVSVAFAHPGRRYQRRGQRAAARARVAAATHLCRRLYVLIEDSSTSQPGSMQVSERCRGSSITGAGGTVGSAEAAPASLACSRRPCLKRAIAALASAFWRANLTAVRRFCATRSRAALQLCESS